MREKHCLLIEKVRLIRQANRVKVKLGVDVEHREARAVACIIDATSRASRCWCCGADHVGKLAG
jgi:hypothetical protein